MKLVAENEDSLNLYTMDTIITLSKFKSGPLIVQILIYIVKEYTKHCCEGKSLTLHCSGDDRLSIRYATYGRKTRAICKHWLSWAMKNNCRAGNSTTKVRHLCEGRRSCTVRAKNSVFGDPCWGTKKYLQVTYRCQ